MAEAKKPIDSLINRNLSVFLTFSDENGRLDSPEEAKKHAEALQGALNGDGPIEWMAQYGDENLEAWRNQFQWLSDKPNFEKWNRFKGEALLLRNYLIAEHLYEKPTRFWNDPSRDPDQIYYQNPSEAGVEQSLINLVEKAGSAEKAIRFIEEVKEKYSKEFLNGWDEFFWGYSKEKPFDGRNPYRLAYNLNLLSNMMGRTDILNFIKRVDGIMEWSFSLGMAPTYLRFYDLWQKEGDAFFVKLERRHRVEHFLKKDKILEAMDETMVEKLQNMDAGQFENLKKHIEQWGYTDFFKVFPDARFLEILGDSLSQRFERFLDIFTKKGPDFFEAVHKGFDSDEKISLKFMASYRLASALQENGLEPAQILPKLPPILGPTMDTDLYWFYQNYEDVMPSGTSVYSEQPANDFLKSLLPPILTLQKKGLLKKAFSQLKAVGKETVDIENKIIRPISGRNKYNGEERMRETGRFLALLGKEIGVDKSVKESDLDKISLDDKIFWAKMSVREVSLPNGWNHTEIISSAWARTVNQLRRHYGSWLTNKAPSAEDLKRLDHWIDSVSGRFHLLEPENSIGGPEIAKRLKKFLLEQMALSQNGRVPSANELKTFENEALQPYWTEQNKTELYAAMSFYARPPMELLKEAPLTTHAVAAFIIKNSGYIFHGIDEYRDAFDDKNLQQKLLEIESKVKTLTAKQQELFLDLYFYDRKDVDAAGLQAGEFKVSLLTDYIDRSWIYFSKNAETITQFLADTDLSTKSFGSLYAFETLVDFYKGQGKEKTLALFATWKSVGMEVQDFGGSKRLLNLSAGDIGRFKNKFDKILYYSPESFVPILEMDETTYQRWITFVPQLAEIGIQFWITDTITFMEIPDIIPLLKILSEEKFLNVLQGSPVVTEIVARTILPRLAKDLKNARKTVHLLKKRFGNYSFDEFRTDSTFNAQKNQITFLTTLADLTRFNSELKNNFFYHGEDAWKRYGTTVTANRSGISEHPFLEADPEHPFQINDYAFYTHALSAKTFARGMEGQERDELVENLLNQFAMLPIARRKENRLYSSTESVNRKLLKELPLAQLLKVKWILNNLQNTDFRRQIATLIKEDYADPISEMGGYIAPVHNDPKGIGSLYDPLHLVPVASAKYQQNDLELKLTDALIAATPDPDAREALIQQKKSKIELMDGEYGLPETVRNARFGFPFLFHLHSVANGVGDSADYAGPSGNIMFGGDLAVAMGLSDSLVFTRLDENHFDVDYYGAYPVLGAGDMVRWQEFVIDLGIY